MNQPELNLDEIVTRQLTAIELARPDLTDPKIQFGRPGFSIEDETKTRTSVEFLQTFPRGEGKKEREESIALSQRIATSVLTQLPDGTTITHTWEGDDDIIFRDIYVRGMSDRMSRVSSESVTTNSSATIGQLLSALKSLSDAVPVNLTAKRWRGGRISTSRSREE